MKKKKKARGGWVGGGGPHPGGTERCEEKEYGEKDREMESAVRSTVEEEAILEKYKMDKSNLTSVLGPTLGERKVAWRKDAKRKVARRMWRSGRG